MGVNKALAFILTLIVVGICIIFVANTVILFQTKSDIIRLEQVVITYAHNNGGFINSDRAFQDFFNQGVKDMSLEGKIGDIKFSHPVGQKVQKGTIISVEVTPDYELLIPFSDGKIQVKGKPVKRTGITRIYFKDL